MSAYVCVHITIHMYAFSAPAADLIPVRTVHPHRGAACVGRRGPPTPGGELRL